MAGLIVERSLGPAHEVDLLQAGFLARLVVLVFTVAQTLQDIVVIGLASVGVRNIARVGIGDDGAPGGVQRRRAGGKHHPQHPIALVLWIAPGLDEHLLGIGRAEEIVSVAEIQRDPRRG